MRQSTIETLPFAKSASVRASSRKNRVFVLRDFLLETYKGYLSPGDVILDVAGGKGDLSWLLNNVDNLNSIVVDPRVTKSHHLIRSVAYLRAHPEDAKERAIPHRPTHQPLAALLPQLHGEKESDWVNPLHFRVLVDDDLVQAVRSVKEAQSPELAATIWKTFWETALVKGVGAQTLGYKEEETHDGTTENNTDQVVIDSVQAHNLLMQVRLLVGFHPDQATEAGMDLARELGIPFCIVPCCVFPAEFPHRRLPDGSFVREYKGFLDYLQLKATTTHHDKVKKATLAFHETTTARNTVLYTLPPQLS